METPNSQSQIPRPEPSLKDAVLKQIESGTVPVTPRWKFTFVTFFSVIGAIGIFVLTLFLITFIHFSLSETGAIVLPEFGASGFVSFLLSLPWLLIVFAVVAALILEFWLLHYAFAYRQPLLYSVLGIAACLTLGTTFVALGQVHEQIYQTASTENVPLVKPLYQAAAVQDRPDLHKGMVAEVQDHGFLLRGKGGELIPVIVTKKTRIRPPVAVRVGEVVIVFGQDASGEIQAIGIRHLEHAPVRSR